MLHKLGIPHSNRTTPYHLQNQYTNRYHKEQRLVEIDDETQPWNPFQPIPIGQQLTVCKFQSQIHTENHNPYTNPYQINNISVQETTRVSVRLIKRNLGIPSNPIQADNNLQAMKPVKNRQKKPQSIHRSISNSILYRYNKPKGFRWDCWNAT